MRRAALLLPNGPIGRPRTVGFQPREYDRILHSNWNMVRASGLHQAPSSPPLSRTRLISAFLKARGDCIPATPEWIHPVIVQQFHRTEIPPFEATNSKSAGSVLPGPVYHQAGMSKTPPLSEEQENRRFSFWPVPTHPQLGYLSPACQRRSD